MRELPSLSGLDTWTSVSGWGLVTGANDLVAGRIEDDSIVAFDYWRQGDGTYSPVHWMTIIAISTDLDGRALIIEPRPTVPGIAPPDLVEVHTESAAFEGRFLVSTTDRRFASTLLDQRLMAWLLESARDRTFQVGGSWAAITGPLLPPDAFPEAIADLRGFRQHMPRVAEALFPPPDPAR